MRVRAVLFDWNGTLCYFEGLKRVIGEASTTINQPVSPSDVNDIYEAVLAAQVLPEVQAAERARDLSPEAHRHADMLSLRIAGVDGDLAEAIYARQLHPDSFVPFLDVRSVLKRLKALGLRIGVVSDCGWDLRRNFEYHGLLPLVDEFILSFEQGRTKPDPILFETACDQLEIDPEATLMVGDSPLRDGSAVSVGINTYLLRPMHEQGVRGLGAVERLIRAAA